MAGASVIGWLAVTAIGGDRVNPEAFYGMAGPLASACLTWVVIDRTWRASPERLTGVMVVGFAAKLVFFGVYVAVMLRGLSVRPVPFVAAFVGFFIALYAMQALFLKRLTQPGGPEGPPLHT
jgi:hypothetical protein